MISHVPETRPAPTRPTLAFQVGVTGHRKLPTADLGGIRLAASTLLRTLRERALALHAADQAESEPLYSATPPVLRCVCGLAEGADTILAEAALEARWDLVVVLPFPADEFAADFAPDTVGQYRSLLARATEICALDGNRETSSAYADVGQVLTEQADLLLAVWDGEPARGPGGTEDVLRRCLGRGLPVAILPASGAAIMTWLDASAGDCDAILRATVLPPTADIPTARAYFSQPSRDPAWARSAIRAYETIVTIGFTQPPMPAAPPIPRHPAAVSLEPAFLPADRLATEHAARYRAAGLMRYGLILPATLASLFGWYGSGWMQPVGNLADFAILLFLLRFSAKGWWEPSHRRFMAFRVLAEYLRNARMLAVAGAVAQPPGAAAHQEKSVDWTAWYCRAAVREQGLPPIKFDPESMEEARRFVRAETLGQVNFLRGRAARFDAIARRLRQIGVALSICGIVFSGVRAVLLVAASGTFVLREFNELALVLPAMAPVFLGLLSFNEYDKLAERYRAVAAELAVQLTALEAAPPHRPAVLTVARHIADIMLAEGADWKRLIKARTVSAY